MSSAQQSQTRIGATRAALTEAPAASAASSAASASATTTPLSPEQKRQVLSAVALHTLNHFDRQVNYKKHTPHIPFKDIYPTEDTINTKIKELVTQYISAIRSNGAPPSNGSGGGMLKKSPHKPKKTKTKTAYATFY